MAEITREEVLRLVQQEIDRLPNDLRAAVSLTPVSAEVRRTDEGDWVVPVEARISLAIPPGLTLHRIISDLQDRVEGQVRAFVSILLAA